MSAADALSVVVVLLVVPGLVWLLGRTGWSGDRKRAAILVVAAILGIIQAIITGLIVLPDAWADAITRGLIMLAGVVTLSQAFYQMLAAKLPDTKAKRALEGARYE